MKFSVIIPTYNPKELDIIACVESATRQTFPKGKYEVLLVDDCSTNWFANAAVFGGVVVDCTDVNGGPGAARNAALKMAEGEWVVFLDSDDKLNHHALEKLSAFISAHPDIDAIGYGWDWAGVGQDGINQRMDGAALSLPKNEMLKEYLRLHMDGSVIFTAVKRELIEQHSMRFRKGLHEDIDFIFDVYRHAKKVAYLPEILYHKRRHPDAVTSSITQAHVDGFFEGWAKIGAKVWTCGEDGIAAQWWEDYEEGTVNVIATRIREVCWKAANSGMMEKLKSSIPKSWTFMVKYAARDTMYTRAAKQFLFEDSFDPSIFKKSWSCTDLHGSLFLAPDEVRACCKRFFSNGKMKGDVVLLKQKAVKPSHVSMNDDGEFEMMYAQTPFNPDPAIILAAKQDLLLRINKGEETPCTGCPFMEFKEWGSVAPLSVRYLSMEHHSVCNMKCNYCDETYYGKKQPAYNVGWLLGQLKAVGALNACHTVVWGGGEPVLGKGFADSVMALMSDTTANQRFLTNSLVFSPVIATAVRSGRATITTSIDAGTEKTFAKVRGTELGMHRVLNNLRDYSAINPQAVTIKYILTDDNLLHNELKHFKDEIVHHQLTECNFQISCNFKQGAATMDEALAALQLFTLLREAGCHVVFFDDLLMQRIVVDDVGISAARWMRLNYADIRAWPENYSKVVVWGTGGMTDWTIEHTDFLKKVGVITRNHYIPGAFHVITGSQGYAENYRKALAAGVPEDSIIKGVIL